MSLCQDKYRTTLTVQEVGAHGHRQPTGPLEWCLHGTCNIKKPSTQDWHIFVIDCTLRRNTIVMHPHGDAAACPMLSIILQ